MRLAALIAGLVALAVAGCAQAVDPVERGRALLAEQCASCHGMGMEEASSHPDAPAFRELPLRYDVTMLSEALVEGLVTGHEEMPVFTFSATDAEAVVAYLQSLAPDGIRVDSN